MSTITRPSRAPDATGWDVERIRQDFPALHQQVHGKPLVYLDNAATTQKPQAVIDALTAYYTRDNANIHRGVHLLSERATDAYESARRRIQRHLNAASPREIVFVRQATEAINLVAASFGRKAVGAGDEIVISAIEHHANIVPWQMLCEEKGARLKVVPVDDRGDLIMDEYARLLGPRTRLVAITQVSNALGTVTPIEEIIRLARRENIPVLLDGAQAAPHQAVDVRALDCDFFVFSGHKVYGPTGIGILYGKAALLEAMPPWQGGGDMIEQVALEGSTWAAPPARFEAGTPPIAAVLGLATALDYFEEVGRREDVQLNFMLEPGHAIFFNNCTMLHNRTSFEDDPDPARKRHLLRLWLMLDGAWPLTANVHAYKGTRGIVGHEGTTTYYRGNAI